MSQRISERVLPAEAGSTLLGPTRDVSGDGGHVGSIVRLLYEQFRTDFSCYRPTTLERRLTRRARLAGCSTLAELAGVLRTNEKELGALHHDLMIGVTQFFREPRAFERLGRAISTELLERIPPNEEIRVWVPACATGEEAYSLAMLLWEQCETAGRRIRFRIVATDAHRALLKQASAGIYRADQLEAVGEARTERFFNRLRSGDYRVDEKLRQLVLFASHDVIRDAPFTRLHLVSCRNLLIYFTPEAQHKALSSFHLGLQVQSLLFLGASETPGDLASEFRTIDESAKIYSKRRDLHLPPTSALPTGARPMSRAPSNESELLGIYDKLLDRHMPPSFLLSTDLRLIDSFGGAAELLRVPGRRPSATVLDLLTGELRAALETAARRTLETRHPTVCHDVALDGSQEGRRRGTLRTELVHGSWPDRAYVLVAMDEGLAIADDETRAREEHRATRDRMQTLEGELANTRHTLRSTIEELRAANEELQASNEELAASNEQLRSTNEEVCTLNTEHRKKIRELRNLNSDVQHLLEGSGIAVLFLHRNLHIRKYTPQMASVFRIRPEDMGRSIRDFSHGLAYGDLLEELERSMAQNVVIEREVRDQNGTPYFMRILPQREPQTEDVDPSSGPQQELGICGAILTLTDISTLDEARSRLQRMSAIVESSDDAIIGKTLDGTITSWNRGAERLYGYTRAEALRQNIRFLVPPEGMAEVEGFLDSVQRGEWIDHVETSRVRKDGEIIDVSITISPIHDAGGRIVGASAIARDITQRKRAQLELAQTSERLRLLLDSTAEAIYGLDARGVCTFSNAACARLLGYASPEDLKGRNLPPLIQRLDESDQPIPSDQGALYEPLRTGSRAHADNERFVRADGTSFPVEYWSHPVRRGESIEGAVVTFLDITERKRTESQIVAAARRREQFLAMLSHELRNPLAAVLSATQVLRLDAPDSPDDARARMVIERQSQHMARLLDDLLDVSRITRGRLSLRKRVVDLVSVIQASVEAMSPRLDERELDARIVLPEGPLHVYGDSTRLQQVVVNLLSNAARYSPRGRRIWLNVSATEHQAELEITDEGDGISPEMLPEIFDLFVQSGQGLDRTVGGLGVGLTLVREIISLHGGTVRAASEGQGRGSTFSIQLPRAQATPASSRESPTEGVPVARSLRVMVVEDQADTREMLRILLETSGHEVFEAEDGRTAVDLIREQRPDVALVDIGLPTIDGYEVAKRIRRDPELKDVLLVALTGYGTHEDVAAAHQAGFDQHLTKPTDPAVLEALLARAGRR